MPSQSMKQPVAKFPLRLMASVRNTAKRFSEKEGVSLNQFINVAVAEKLARLEHEEWLRTRLKPTPELLAEALSILQAGPDTPLEPGDELPAGYTPLKTHTAAPFKAKRLSRLHKTTK